MLDLKHDIIQLSNLIARVRDKQVFKDLSLDIKRDKITGIMGLNSQDGLLLTQLLTVYMLADSGRVIINGRKVTELSDDEVQNLQKKIGVVLSRYTLDAQYSVYDNLLLSLNTDHQLPKEMLIDIFTLVLEMVGLRDQVANSLHKLSEGELLRLSLACALVNDPAILVYNDPFVIKDFDDKGIEPLLINQLHHNMNLSSIVISNDAKRTLTVADYVYVISDGKVIAKGSADELKNTSQQSVKSFLQGLSAFSKYNDQEPPAFLC